MMRIGQGLLHHSRHIFTLPGKTATNSAAAANAASRRVLLSMHSWLVEAGGKRVERPYSIASSPAEDELEFFFELVPEGALTPLLHKLQPGDQMLMRKVPKGRFSLDTQNGKTNHLLISTVTGVAPWFEA